MIDFNKSIFENKRAKRTPFLVAHRGVNGAKRTVQYDIGVQSGG